MYILSNRGFGLWASAQSRYLFEIVKIFTIICSNNLGQFSYSLTYRQTISYYWSGQGMWLLVSEIWNYRAFNGEFNVGTTLVESQKKYQLTITPRSTHYYSERMFLIMLLYRILKSGVKLSTTVRKGADDSYAAIAPISHASTRGGSMGVPTITLKYSL